MYLSLLLLPLLLLYTAFHFYTTRLRTSNRSRRATLLGQTNSRVVGFFHPYCNAGGGGERVLWTAILSLQQTHPDIISIVYTGDVDVSKSQILTKVKSRFGISLNPATVHFIFLHSRQLIEESTWPRFTLLGQSLGSMYLAWESLTLLIPDLFIDTMGYAFTFPIVRLLGGIPVGTYIHYPTISTKMLTRVRERRGSYVNSTSISSSWVLTWGKLLYYRLFMYYYTVSLKSSSFIMVNGSWTGGHIRSILSHSDVLLDLLHLIFPPLFLLRFFLSPSPAKGESGEVAALTPRVVFPPCPTKDLSSIPLTPRERIVLSLAQFRPEKDHKTQLLAFSHLLKTHPEYHSENPLTRVELVLIGGSRNEADSRRVEDLKKLAKELGIEDQTTFIINATYPETLTWLGKASIGLNTMVDEHFGISVVEYMAAALIPVVHASAGPFQDIVVPHLNQPTGFHATSPESYADAIHSVFQMSEGEQKEMRQRARESVCERFSEEVFCKGWEAALGSGGWDGWVSER